MSKLLLCILLLSPAHFTDQSASNIGTITPPPGFERIRLSEDSFGSWLRKLSLKKDRQVYLYDGRLKPNQSAQYAVLDVPVGKKDLQQCADAIMRLRAEYLMDTGREDSIAFKSTSGQTLRFRDWKSGTRYKLSGHKLIAYQTEPGPGTKRDKLESYLEFVFTYCGTLSLERELKRSVSLGSVSPGDVLIRGGSPGHAMIVVDVAANKQGKRIFMLAQSYMPAQDIHIVRNPNSGSISPWYEANANAAIETPEWDFTAAQLRSW